MILNEIWKPINNFYEVSNLGNVRSTNRTVIYKNGQIVNYKSKLLSQAINTSGYNYVVITINNKRCNKLVHRLVAEAFISNPNNYPYINHKDENKQNNNVNNLEWCTSKINMNSGTVRQRISKNRKVSIIRIDKDGNKVKYSSISAAALDNNVSISAISKNLTGKNKSCKGYLFVYL